MRLLLIFMFLSGCNLSPEEKASYRKHIKYMVDNHVTCVTNKYETCICIIDLVDKYGMAIDPSGRSCGTLDSSVD